jgi:hypothetical protein
MKKIQFGVVVDTEGNKTEVQGEGKDGRFTLEQMYRLLDCSLVQLVSLRPKQCQGFKEVWCDEEGKLKPEAVVNYVATLIAKPVLFSGDCIVGKALFVEAKKREVTK